MGITPKEDLMVLHVAEKRINRKILDHEIFDGSYTKLITTEDFSFEDKVIIYAYYHTSVSTSA